MNIWQEMESHLKEYTPKELEIYELVKKDPYSFTASTAMDIAKRYHVSQSAISRFCQRNGFNGFSDFRMSMMVSSTGDTLGRAKHEMPHEYVSYLTDYVHRVDQCLTPQLSEQLCSLVLNADHIYTSGYGASNVSAEMLSLRLTLCGIRSYNIPTSQEMEFLHIITHKDVVFLFSAANPSHKDFFSLVDEMPKEKRPYIVLVSYVKKHPFSKKVDLQITLPTWNTLSYNHSLDSNVGQVNFCFLLTEKIVTTIREHDDKGAKQ